MQNRRAFPLSFCFTSTKIFVIIIATNQDPDRRIIIEVDGKRYHDHHSQHDKQRTRNIQDHYPDVTVLRYTWKDLSDEDIMKVLFIRLKE